MIAFTYFKLQGSSGTAKASRQISRKYVEGIRGNLAAIQAIYGHTWIMRLYHNLGQEEDTLLQQIMPLLTANHSMLDLCDINHNPLLGNASMVLPTIWRFLPLLDDQVSGLTI